MLKKLVSLFPGKRRIALTPLALPNMQSFMLRLLRAGYAITFPCPEAIHIPRFAEQWHLVEKVIQTLPDRYFSRQDIALLQHVLKRHVEAFLCKKQNTFTYDILLTGCLLERPRRFLAAIARAHHKPVVCVSHGDGDYFIVDEPRTGFGELSYATHIVGYGIGGQRVLEHARYARSLYTQPRFIPARSDFISTLFNKKKHISRIGSLKKPRFMYVPNCYLGVFRYAPYTALPDAVYYAWQQMVLRLFPGVIYKAHPKNAVKSPLVSADTLGGNLENCMHMADVFIFDVISTAFNIIAATDKPIIYFDIGLRCFHDAAIEDIKGRCVWIDAQHDKNEESLRTAYLRQVDKECVNNYTETFSTTAALMTRAEKVLEVVKTIAVSEK
jgi:hypothetical protein